MVTRNDVISNVDDTYRWYLCIQTFPARWTCEQKMAAELFSSHIHTDPPLGSTIINVYKFIPPVFDNAIVKHKIKSIQNVNILTKAPSK